MVKTGLFPFLWILSLFALAGDVYGERDGKCFSLQEAEPLTRLPDQKMKEYIEEDFIFYCEDRRLTEEDSKCLYVEAVLSIARDNLPKARGLLEKAVDKDPTYPAPRAQLAYVYLWMGKLEEARDSFAILDALCPCNPIRNPGLSQIADQWALQMGHRDQAIEICRDLVRCEPEQVAYLYKLGSVLAFAHKYREAEEVLQKCLAIDPSDSDAGIRLGYVYLWQDKLDKAAKVFTRYCSLPEAQEALGTIAYRQSHYEEAKHWYKESLQGERRSENAEQSLARLYASDLQFTPAKEQYKELLQTFPGNESARRELFEVKQHTDPSLVSKTQYTQSKENDPNLKIPVVRDYYFNTDIMVYVPIYDQWRLDLRSYWGFQKEKDIAIPNGGNNYYADMIGGGITSRLLFLRYCAWNLFCNVRSAWGVGKMNYPFLHTTQLQPGSYFIYNSDTQLFAIGGYIDSFLIKNFTKIISDLLQTRTVDARYAYRFPCRFKPELEGWAEEMFIHDSLHNRRDSESIAFRFMIPGLERFAKFSYLFEHKHFEKLNPNYYSYKQQWNNKIGIDLKGEFNLKTTLELIYEHGWQRTKDLFQPIGNFLLVTPLQKLTNNKIKTVVGFRVSDVFKAELGTHYYRDTLPYREWNIYGNFQWVF